MLYVWQTYGEAESEHSTGLPFKSCLLLVGSNNTATFGDPKTGKGGTLHDFQRYLFFGRKPQSTGACIKPKLKDEIIIDGIDVDSIAQS